MRQGVWRHGLVRRWTGVMAVGVLAGASLAAALPRESQGGAKGWPQWRGAQRDGISTDSKWLENWKKGAPNPAWTATLGSGYSAVVVVDGRLYTMGYQGGKDTVYCLNVKDGQTVWRHDYTAENFDNMNAGGPSCTPAVHNGKVYSVSRDGQFFCLDAQNGKVAWSKDLRKELGAKAPTWGLSGSPLIYKNQIIVDVGVTAAYEADSGKMLWQTKNYGGGYSSPIPFNREGKEYLAVFNGLGLVLLQPADGKEAANFPWKTNYDVNAATPIIQDDLIFISSGYNTGCALVRFADGKLQAVWQNKNMRNHMATCVLWKDYLYGFDDGVLKCLELKTGREAWAQRGFGKGTVTLAAGKLLVLSEKGEMVIAEPAPEAFKEETRATVLSGQCWTVPVVVDNRIYCRNSQGQLICLDLSGS